jgi:hypothetical protein
VELLDRCVGIPSSASVVGIVLPPISPGVGFEMDSVWIEQARSQVEDMYVPEDLQHLPKFSSPKRSTMNEFEAESKEDNDDSQS